MSTNVWASVAGVAGYLPMSALTGATGQLLGMNAAATLAEWKAATFLNNQMAVPVGAVGAPSYIFTGSLTTGFYSPAADQVALSILGVQKLLASVTAGLATFNFTGNIQLTSGLVLEAQSANIAAAATTDLGTATGNYVYVTNNAGAVLISSLGGATLPAGTEVETKFVITGGSVTLLQDPVALALLGGATLALQTGDVIRWRKTNGAAAYWEMVSIQRGIGTSVTGFKNRVINGDMRIDQANEGALVSVNNATYFFGPDCWTGFGAAAAGVFSMQRLSATPPTGYKNYLRIQTTTADAAPAAGSTYEVDTKIEGLNLIDFQLGQAGAVQFTTSLQMRSSLTGTFSGTFNNLAANRTYPWTCTITQANTWTPVVLTLTGDTAGVWPIDNTCGLMFRIDIGSGATYRGAANAWQAATLLGVTGAVRLISTLNATLDITGVQIEKNSVATAFEFRDYQSELARCQRYFAKTYSQGVVPGTIDNKGVIFSGIWGVGGGGNINWKFPTEMRAIPTCTGYSQATGTAGKWIDGASADQNVTLTLISTGSLLAQLSVGTLSGLGGHLKADARM